MKAKGKILLDIGKKTSLEESTFYFTKLFKILNHLSNPGLLATDFYQNFERFYYLAILWDEQFKPHKRGGD